MERTLCFCKMVTQKEVMRSLRKGASNLEELQRYTPAGTQCGRCVPVLQQLLDRHLARRKADTQLKIDFPK